MLQTRDKFLNVVETMVQNGYVAFVFLRGRRGYLVVVLLARYIVLTVGCNAELNYSIFICVYYTLHEIFKKVSRQK